MRRALDLVHISVGDIFRWNVQYHTKLGAQVRRMMAAGELVDDDLVESIVRDRLAEHDWNYGFIVDGFPRNARQAEFFLESYDIDGVILLDLPDERGDAARAGAAPVRPVRARLQPDRPPPEADDAATCAAARWWRARTTTPRRSRRACATTTPRRSRSSSCSSARSSSSRSTPPARRRGARRHPRPGPPPPPNVTQAATASLAGGPGWIAELPTGRLIRGPSLGLVEGALAVHHVQVGGAPGAPRRARPPRR